MTKKKKKKEKKKQKVATRGFELACSNPRCLCGRSSRRSWSHRRHILAVCYFGVFKGKQHRDFATFGRAYRHADKLDGHLRCYLRVRHLLRRKIYYPHLTPAPHCQSRNGQSELRFIGRSELRFGSQSQHAWRLSRNIPQ